MKILIDNPGVFISQSDAFDKIVAIEGEVYRKRKIKGNSFKDFKSRWQTLSVIHSDFTKRKFDELIVFGSDEENNFIHGLEVNRYFVLFSGEIVFSLNHAQLLEDVKKAAELGFRIIFKN